MQKFGLLRKYLPGRYYVGVLVLFCYNLALSILSNRSMGRWAEVVKHPYTNLQTISYNFAPEYKGSIIFAQCTAEKCPTVVRDEFFYFATFALLMGESFFVWTTKRERE